ncbi:MAG: SET domain-containing protein [Sedimentisphaeraceae bacterium JB056]
MLHMATRVQYVSEQIGFGVFATRDIPVGTIIVVLDPFDIVVSKEDAAQLSAILISNAERYMYRNKNGDFVLSWDNAKYLNHSCFANTMMTDYGFEIVVRDIRAGEQITTEYGLLNVQEEFDVDCGCESCRRKVCVTDIDMYYPQWDRLICNAIKSVKDVQQPLYDLLNIDLQHEISRVAEGQSEYSSILNLKWRGF